MNFRVVNAVAKAWKVTLLVLYVAYMLLPDRPFGLPFIVVPFFTIMFAFTILAAHQYKVAHEDYRPFWQHPVPFPWVLCLFFASFALLLWWIFVAFWIDTYHAGQARARSADTGSYELFFSRTFWLTASFIAVWFTRRFVEFTGLVKAQNAREILQNIREGDQNVREGEQNVRESDQNKRDERMDAELLR